MRSALARSDGLILDGLNQARVIVSTVRHINPRRPRRHAQKVIWRGPQERVGLRDGARPGQAGQQPIREKDLTLNLVGITTGAPSPDIESLAANPPPFERDAISLAFFVG